MIIEPGETKHLPLIAEQALNLAGTKIGNLSSQIKFHGRPGVLTVYPIRVSGLETQLVPLPGIAEQKRFPNDEETKSLCEKLKPPTAIPQANSCHLLEVVQPEATMRKSEVKKGVFL